MILIGRVLAVEHTAKRPLVYFSGNYCSLDTGRQSRPAVHAGDGSESHSEDVGLDGDASRIRTVDR